MGKTMAESKFTPGARIAIEKERVAAIENVEHTCAFHGHESLIARMKADGQSTAGDVAMAVIAAERAKLAAAAAGNSRLGDGASAATGRFPDLEAVERTALATWARDPAIRAEFRDNRNSYVALCRAEAMGRVRILGRRTVT